MSGLRKKAIVAVTIILTLFVVIAFVLPKTGSNAQENPGMEKSKLLVVWTSGDKEVAMKMVYMYTYNAKKQGWFDEVRFLIWGPSSRLLAADKELQEYLGKMKDEGVELLACKACADMYGVSDRLAEMGVDVKYMGRPFTDMLKSDWETITF